MCRAGISRDQGRHLSIVHRETHLLYFHPGPRRTSARLTLTFSHHLDNRAVAMDFSDSDESPRLSGTFDLFNHAIELPAIDNQPARRLSMEEDYFYEQVMTFAQPLQPPAYHAATHGTYEGPSRKGKEAVLDDDVLLDRELLPAYSCDVHMETVFQMKMEIEDAVKRAEYRNWRTMFVELHGTALHIYSAKKKDFGWGKNRMHGPDVRPDNPSWLRKGLLERSYSLQHADVGIAADYHKYVPSPLCFCLFVW